MISETELTKCKNCLMRYYNKMLTCPFCDYINEEEMERIKLAKQEDEWFKR